MRSKQSKRIPKTVYQCFGCDDVKKKKLVEKAMERINKTLNRPDLPELVRKKGSKGFVRSRQLTGKRLAILILSGIRLPLQLATDALFKAIGCAEESVSKQAVSKARSDFDPDFVKSCFTDLVKEGVSCSDMELFKGKYRLCAIDGSDVALDNAPALKEEFGCSGRAKSATTAMASIAYDPLNNWILDASLSPYKTSERTAAKEHIAAVSALDSKKNLFILDRGYPSREFMAELIEARHKFVMRVRRKFSLDFDDVGQDEKVVFVWAEKSYRVRVIKVELPSGEIETLVTNLSSKTFPTGEAGALYFQRWAIETKFDSLKNRLALENMSGRRPVTVYQDFWATMYIANIFAALQYRTDDVISAKTEGSGNKHAQKTNETRLIKKFRDQFIECLIESRASKRCRLFDALINDIVRDTTEIKPGRSSPRKIPRDMRFHDRRKAVL